MVRLVGGVAAACMTALVLSGCGSGSSTAVDATGPSAAGSSPTSAPSTHAASDLPPCHTVWRAGAILPGSYAGCVQGQDVVHVDRFGCSSGQRMVRFDDHWYAVAGGRIQHSEVGLLHNATYLHSVRVCRG